MPPDADRLAQLVLPSLASAADSRGGALRTLVLTDDEETAVAVARIASREIGGGLAPIVALTGAARAKRLLQSTIPAAAVMPASVAGALLAQSALPVGNLRQVIVAMASPAERAGFETTLAAVLTEIPKTASRTLVSARETPEVESIVERHFFKARRVRDAGGVVPPYATGRIQILPATPGTRWDTVRRLIDQIDPPAAAILATNAATFAEAQHELSTLGYGAEGPVVVTRDAPEAGTHMIVLVGSPDAASLQRAAAATPAHLVVVCAPSEIANVRAIAGPMRVQAITLDGAAARATSREVATRARLREILSSGEFARELAAITPLLDEYDGSEVAAAALVMAAEATRQPPAAPPTPTAPPAPPKPRREVKGDPRREVKGDPRRGPRR
jgi:ATP-dependent RNA helicase DeaD